MKNRLIFVPAAVIVFTCFLIGTFIDLQISQSFANINSFFPKDITGFAVYPLSLIIAFIGGSMIKVIMSKRYIKIYKNIIVGLFGVICICFATFLCGDNICSYLAFNLSKKFLIPLGICASIPGDSGFLFI